MITPSTPHHHNNPTLAAIRELRNTAHSPHQSAAAFSAFVKATSQLPISQLGYWERVLQREVWQAPQPRWRFGFKQHLGHQRPALIPWLDYCSANGYQRERAIQALSEGAPNSILCAILLRRLNDWVPEVRAAARERIPVVVQRTEPRYMLEALWGILPHLYTWGRLNRNGQQVLKNLLGARDMPHLLSEKIISATAGPAPTILGQTGRQPAFDRYLPKISACAIQPAARAKAYTSQLDGCVSWIEGYRWTWIDQRWNKGRYTPIISKRAIPVHRTFVELLEAAATDSSPLVRRVAGNALLTAPNSLQLDVLPIAKILARDASPSVAERGKFALRNISL